jgi:hypothetical protein
MEKYNLMKFMEYIDVADASIYNITGHNQIGVCSWDRITINKDGKLHSYNDNPAIITVSCEQYWLENGYLYRTTGPAVIFKNIDRFRWWVNSLNCVSKDDFQKYAQLSNEDMTVIMRKYGDIILWKITF